MSWLTIALIGVGVTFLVFALALVAIVSRSDERMRNIYDQERP